ncbi:hypothetical protein Glove_411g26 [Diversispora epigaea]|uniref:Uncharacterized protein n=1 Tax=Diversispora epigaea TaxID=1348612 RepID=A0A397GZ88_9GLOM|nr:hypothetical protein Glove_411g26 [Diversispora epigaea]
MKLKSISFTFTLMKVKFLGSFRNKFIRALEIFVPKQAVNSEGGPNIKTVQQQKQETAKRIKATKRSTAQNNQQKQLHEYWKQLKHQLERLH